MATRRETVERKAALLRDLREACRSGALVVGEMAPSHRELAQKYHLSVGVVGQELQKLVQEGLFRSTPGVGTFVGQPRNASVQPYLLILPHQMQPGDYGSQIQMGFEERIAQLGGVSLMLTVQEAIEHLNAGELPSLAGVYEHHSTQFIGALGGQLPSVCFGKPGNERTDVDMIHFDDGDGGQQATRHLIAMGHRNIAFLALRDEGDSSIYFWSAEREEGWRCAMLQAGLSVQDMAFHAAVGSDRRDEQIAAAREAAVDLARRRDVEAVIAANSFALQGLFEALNQAGVPLERWPAVVCFDDDPMVAGAIASYLRLPWENVGQTAAQLLWERKTGRLTGPGQQKSVPMRLIPRLSCRQKWTSESGLAKRRAASQLKRHDWRLVGGEAVEVVSGAD